jgi:hypothetical protein
LAPVSELELADLVWAPESVQASEDPVLAQESVRALERGLVLELAPVWGLELGPVWGQASEPELARAWGLALAPVSELESALAWELGSVPG